MREITLEEINHIHGGINTGLAIQTGFLGIIGVLGFADFVTGGSVFGLFMLLVSSIGIAGVWGFFSS